jgi:NAD(P)-dependent dehydrogenase (short-subunit alcohol dehydrogenase family)
MPSLTALILGAGSNIGQSLATLLKQKGYAVAVGSRNPDFDHVKKEGFFPVRVDVSKPESIKDAFATVNAELGPPNLVVYNGNYSIFLNRPGLIFIHKLTAAVFKAPPDPTDPLSLPLENFKEAVFIGLGVFVAAQQALPGFRSATHKDSTKTFIVTGNLLPFIPPTSHSYFGLDTQKSIQARLVDLFSSVYSKEDIR